MNVTASKRPVIKALERCYHPASLPTLDDSHDPSAEKADAFIQFVSGGERIMQSCIHVVGHVILKFRTWWTSAITLLREHTRIRMLPTGAAQTPLS